MRILYGIQGTGNGHITHSREVIAALSREAEVDVLVSGVEYDLDLGFEPAFRSPGLGYAFGTDGGIDYLRSLGRLRPWRLVVDLLSLPVERYDAVVSDFEPLTAWAACMKGISCYGLSHQASFLSPHVPRPPRRSAVSELILHRYAPCTHPLGLHFRRYDTFVFHPVIRSRLRRSTPRSGTHYTVYLPSFDERSLAAFLQRVDVPWEVFSKHYRGRPYEAGNVTVHPLGDERFAASLLGAAGVLCGAGFDTPAEALYLGKKLMVIPMRRQYEQACNAAALAEMGVRVGAPRLDDELLTQLLIWIEDDAPVEVEFEDPLPDIVDAIVGGGRP